MRRAVIMILIAASLSLVPITTSAVPTITVYRNCAQVLKDFPHGVARGAKASYALYSTGWFRPKIMHRTYLANRALDTNHNGVICEQRP